MRIFLKPSNTDYKIPTISQNKNTFIKFKINYTMCSIELLLNWRENIFLENIFLTFKAFIFNKKIPIKNIYVFGFNETNEEKNINIFHHVSIAKLKKINFLDFVDWFDELYLEDERYLDNFTHYGFGFGFPKDFSSQLEKTLLEISWDDNFKKYFLPKYGIIEENVKLKTELEEKKKEIQNLKNLINEFTKRK